MSVASDTIAATASAIALLTPATDEGAPTVYRLVDAVRVEESAEDLPFTVRITGLEELNVTGISGQVHERMGMNVRLKVRNEGRSETAFAAILANHIRIIRKGVFTHFNNSSVTGVGTVFTDGPAEVSYEASGNAYVDIPFTAEIYDNA